jgi:hypothetical protein
VFNSNGTAIVNATPLPVSMFDFGLQVSRGLVANVQNLNIAGFQTSVGGSWIPLWDGGATAYVYPSSAIQMRIWSSSASDTNVAVTINGLDSGYNIQSEVVTLTNGATGILSTKSYLRVNSITSATNAVGTIYCGSSDKTVTYQSINIGDAKSASTLYTVANGYTFYLTQVTSYTNQNGNQSSLYRSWSQTANGVVTINVTFPLVQGLDNRKVAPRAYPQKTDIQWQFQSSGTSQIGAQIEGYLIQGT